MINRLFECIHRRKEEYKQFLKDIVAIESYTQDKEGVDKVVDFIAAFAGSHGFNTRVQPFPRAGNGLVVTINEDAQLPPVAFLGHTDTVHKKGVFGYPAVREDGDKIYGPGITDMKGGIAVAMLAMQALSDAGYDKRPVKLILTSDEEVSESLSGKEGIDFICREAQGCAAAINCEGTPNKGYVTVGRRGSVRLHVEITGRAAHAGMAYADGISAIKEAAHKVIAIESKSAPDNITINCGIINGGGVANIVPEKCSFVLYTRFVNMKQREEALEHIDDIINKSFIPGTRAKKTIIAQRPPMEITEKNMMLYEHIKKVSLAHGFGTLEWELNNGGSDSAYTSMIGVPSVCSMGVHGGRIHSLEEFAYTESLYSQAKLLCAVVCDLPDNFE